MFNFKKKIYSEIKRTKQLIKIKKLVDGVNLFSNYIIYKNLEKIKIYDRKCDHAGGKIISKDGQHICPQHNWTFNPKIGKYKNGISKKETPYITEKGNLIFYENEIKPQITKANKNSEVQIRFFNHAFLQVKTNEFKFATDPWAIGPAFNTGWWLKLKSKSDWIEELNSCNFIYVSHNHPDHLHKITLSKVKPFFLK